MFASGVRGARKLGHRSRRRLPAVRVRCPGQIVLKVCPMRSLEACFVCVADGNFVFLCLRLPLIVVTYVPPDVLLGIAL